MGKKQNDATPARPDGNRVIDAKLVTIDLNEYTKQIKDEKSWDKNDRNAITVFKTDNITLVLIALHKNAKVDPPLASNDTTILQVREGTIQFTANSQNLKLEKDQIITVHKNISFSITALKESVLLLTMISNKL